MVQEMDLDSHAVPFLHALLNVYLGMNFVDCEEISEGEKHFNAAGSQRAALTVRH